MENPSRWSFRILGRWMNQMRRCRSTDHPSVRAGKSKTPYRCGKRSSAVIINHAEILDNRCAVVAIAGPLDSFTSPDFEDYVNQLLAKNILFILFDAGKMEYVSSEGIGLLLFLQRKISEANGFFVMFNLSSEIQTLYRLLGFDKVFRIAESRAEALQIMDRQREPRDRGVSGQGEPRH